MNEIKHEEYIGQMDVCNYCEQPFNRDEKIIGTHRELVRAAGVPSHKSEIKYATFDNNETYATFNGNRSQGEITIGTMEPIWRHIMKPCMHICDQTPIKTIGFSKSIVHLFTKGLNCGILDKSFCKPFQYQSLNYVWSPGHIDTPKTFGALRQWTDHDLLSLKGLGIKTISFIRQLEDMANWKIPNYRIVRELYPHFSLTNAPFASDGTFVTHVMNWRKSTISANNELTVRYLRAAPREHTVDLMCQLILNPKIRPSTFSLPTDWEYTLRVGQ